LNFQQIVQMNYLTLSMSLKYRTEAAVGALRKRNLPDKPLASPEIFQAKLRGCDENSVAAASLVLNPAICRNAERPDRGCENRPFGLWDVPHGPSSIHCASFDRRVHWAIHLVVAPFLSN
jgi:hypothetical protein